MVNDFEARLLNDFQHDFPLCATPFAKLAFALGVSERRLLDSLEGLQATGKISRVGPVFAPRRVGASTLVAMAVPPAELERTAEIINRFPGVNHNYEREHAYNLWFVATAVDEQALSAMLVSIRSATGRDLLSLPMEAAFHIDLGFALGQDRPTGRLRTCHAGAHRLPSEPAADLGPMDRRLVAALQKGLPLLTRPFAFIAHEIGDHEFSVLERVSEWLQKGIIKRFGVVVRHHELGYTANAMLVHDIPDARVAEFGQALAGEEAVTLCYQRRRHVPDWPYNLFCMIHGRERATVEAQIADLRAQYGLTAFPHAVLFSRTRFKQQGACYA